MYLKIFYSPSKTGGFIVLKLHIKNTALSCGVLLYSVLSIIWTVLTKKMQSQALDYKSFQSLFYNNVNYFISYTLSQIRKQHKKNPRVAVGFSCVISFGVFFDTGGHSVYR